MISSAQSVKSFENMQPSDPNSMIKFVTFYNLVTSVIMYSSVANPTFITKLSKLIDEFTKGLSDKQKAELQAVLDAQIDKYIEEVKSSAGL
ncbi:MAG: hypothetical protein Fur003_0910 [Candidatus Dojkabacteria bacterium]